MSTQIPFSIGGVTLSNFEVPEEFDFGTELSLVVHKYIDEIGNPIIKTHSQGAFPLPTSWKGTFYYNTAISRAQQMNALAKAQSVVTWIYGPLQWQVMIKSFKATPKHQFQIDYEIELIVILDQNSSGVSPDSFTVPFDIGTQGFFNQAQTGATALSAADPNLPSILTDAMAAANAAITGGFPLQNQTIAQLLAIQETIGLAVTQLQLYSGPLITSAVLEGDLARLSASLTALQGYGLLNRNLAQLTGSGPYSNSVSNFTGDLYVAAATYYPNSDPTLVAPILAQANGLVDLYVDTAQTLNLPPIFNA